MPHFIGFVCGLLRFRYFSYLNLSFRWGMVMGEGDMWGREDVDWGKRGYVRGGGVQVSQRTLARQ